MGLVTGAQKHFPLTEWSTIEYPFPNAKETIQSQIRGQDRSLFASSACLLNVCMLNSKFLDVGGWLETIECLNNEISFSDSYVHIGEPNKLTIINILKGTEW